MFWLPFVVVRWLSEGLGGQSDVEAGSVTREADKEEAGPLKGVGQLDAAGVERPHAEGLDELSYTRLGLGVIAGEQGCD